MSKISESEKERIRQEIWGKKKILADGNSYYTKGKKDGTLLPGARQDIATMKKIMEQSDKTALPENLEVDAKRLEELHTKKLWEKTQEDVKEELAMVTKQVQDLIYGIEATEDIILEATKNWNSFREDRMRVETRRKGLKYYADMTPEQFKKEQERQLTIK